MEKRRFLVLLRLPENAVQENLKRAETAKDTADKISKGDYQMAFTSSDASFLGIFLKCDLATAQIRARFDILIHRQDRTFVWVLELGVDFSAIGNSRGWQWLQNN